MTSGYCLSTSQIPGFPSGGRWTDILRWCVAVMDEGDDDLAFMASLLSHSVRFGGLTAKQVRYAKEIVERVHQQWEWGGLEFQLADAAPANDEHEHLRHVPVMGTA